MKLTRHHIVRTISPVLLVGLLFMAHGSTARLAAGQGPETSEAKVSTVGLSSVPATPTQMLFSYQGQLLDSSGHPITDPGLSMTFRLYTALTGGTACWSESHTGANAVTVQGGLFHVLLGQILPLNSSCLAQDSFLEIEVNGEVLSPREILVTTPFAYQALTVPVGSITSSSIADGAVTQTKLNLSSGLEIRGSASNYSYLRVGKDSGAPSAFGDWVGLDFLHVNEVSPVPQFTGNPAARISAVLEGGDNQYGLGIWTRNRHDSFSEKVRVTAYGNVGIGTTNPSEALEVNGSIKTNGYLLFPSSVNSGVSWTGVSAAIGRAVGPGNYSVDAQAGDLVIRPTAGNRLILARGTESPAYPAAIVIDSTNTTIKTNLLIGGSDLVLSGRNSGGTGRAGRALVDGGSGAGLTINYANDFGTWRVEGPSSAQLNMGGNSIVNCGALVEANLQTKSEISQGRIDRFEEGDVLCWGIDQLELCSSANDRLVQAVADAQGRPIVIGAEKVKVLGPVRRGDILVASSVPGVAMVDNDPAPGNVIAQALQDFDGDKGLVKGMIRKW